MAARILALLEQADQTRQVQACIESIGNQIYVVDCFAQARANLESHPFDLIIADVHLENGGSVFDFLNWVRQHPRFRDIPCVLFSLETNYLTKYLGDGVQKAARYLGANKYVRMDMFDADLLNEQTLDLLPDATVRYPR